MCTFKQHPYNTHISKARSPFWVAQRRGRSIKTVLLSSYFLKAQPKLWFRLKSELRTSEVGYTTFLLSGEQKTFIIKTIFNKCKSNRHSIFLIHLIHIFITLCHYVIHVTYLWCNIKYYCIRRSSWCCWCHLCKYVTWSVGYLRGGLSSKGEQLIANLGQGWMDIRTMSTRRGISK